MLELKVTFDDSLITTYISLYYSKRKRGYEDDGHVAKEPRMTEEVR